MNNTVKLKKYRKLSIASLLTGIFSCIIFSFPEVQSWPANLSISENIRRILFISNGIIGIMLAIILPVAAIVCGSIDLSKIRKGVHKNKLFKGFDITGIVLGSIIFLIVTMFILGEVIAPH